MLASLRSGEGRVVELAGERHSGKTRLLASWKQEAEAAGLTTLRGCSTEADQDFPYAAFACLVGSRLLSETVDHSGKKRFSHRLDVRQLLNRCAQDGLVLFLDDFHWADSDSVELAEHLIRCPLDVPLLMAVAHRPRLSSERLRSAFAHGAEMGTVESFQLGPPPSPRSGRVAELPTAAPQLRPLPAVGRAAPVDLRAIAPGPATTGEHAIADTADTAGTAATAPGTASLTAEELQVLSACAVLGDGHDWAALTAVAELPREVSAFAIDELVTKGLLVPVEAGTRFALRNPSLRAQLHDRMSLRWRAKAHSRAMNLLARRAAPAAELAPHIEFLPDPHDPDNVDVLERAAREALWGAPRLSVCWLRIAVRMLRESEARDEQRRRRLTLTLASALAISGELVEGCRLFRSTLPGFRELPVRARVHYLAFHALAEGLLDHSTEAEMLLTEGLGLVEILRQPPAEAIGLYVSRGLIGLMDNQPPSVLQAHTAVRLAIRQRDRLAEAGARALLGLCEALDGRTEVAARTLSVSGSLIDGFSDQRLRKHPEYLALLGRAEALIGRFESAAVHLERGVALLRAAEHEHLLPVLLMGVAHVRLRVGPLGQALEAAVEAEAITRRNGSHRVHADARALSALIGEWRDPDRRAPARPAGQADADADPAQAPGHAGVVATLALAAVAQFDGDARRDTARLLEACGGAGLSALPPSMRPRGFELLTATAMEAGDPSSEWSARAMAASLASPGPGSTPYALAACAHTVRGAGDHPRALQLYLDAAADFTAAGLIGDRARMLALGAASAAAAGKQEQAGRLLSAAKLAAEAYGSARLVANLERFEHLVRPHAARPGEPCARPCPLASLTNREREVARLAATGIRNRDIATALALSPKTVEIHLSRIYRKLDVHSKSELVRRIVDLDQAVT
ncbi:helix-turn-helix domain-containing protein [Streptacidiphilus sp. P02-A3a]|nr:helix-turn-helix domain-containing protein [Streptacidiphilus sp. P02-A3a]